MTENEAINEIIKEVCSGCYGSDEEPHRCSTCGFKMAKDALEEIQQNRAIGTVEEVEIPRSKGNEIVAGIMLPKVKGKAVVSLSDLHDILMDVGGINIRDKVFEQIYNRDVIIGLKDVIEKWEERKSMQNNCKYWNAEHEDCALSCEEIRNKAIEEFAERLKKKNYDGKLSYFGWHEFIDEEIDEIAGELKAGGKNEID